MSFLHRRRSFGPGLLPSTSEDALPPLMHFPPAVENIHSNSSQPHLVSLISKGRKTSAGTLIRRVSSLLGKRPKREPAFAPLNVRAPPESRWKPINADDDGSESDVSFDDIRRPSGLGRSVSISSQRSLPPSPFTAIDEESPFHLATKAAHERSRAVSSPNPPRFIATPPTNLMPTSNMEYRNKNRPPPPMPHEVLVGILSFIPRHAVASFAGASNDWCNAARSVLYETIDLRHLRSRQVELLVTLLAYRHDLAELVRTFECHTWPDFFPPQITVVGAHGHTHHPSFSPALTAVFTVAFQNMHLITTLVLPSFDYTFLRHHSAFGLSKLTILSLTMTSNETTQLFAWLDGQINITHLAFPNLLDSSTGSTSVNSSLTIPQTSLSQRNTLKDCLNTYDASTSLSITPSSSPVTSLALLTPAVPTSPFNSLSLLPALTTLVATPSIITSLVTTRPTAIPRPLGQVTLRISNTLYTGLRPAALLSALHGIAILILQFSPVVDRRTIGKVLSAGAVLTLPTNTLSSSSSAISSRDSTDGTSKALLQHLEIQITEQEAGADLALYKIISSSISRYQGLVGLRCCFASVPAPKEPPELTNRETAQVTMWAKHCPSLKSIELLSGARWERVQGS
ncbi:hypothetical protein H0H87_007596 [Tephrocybe sp. NHM501043]|nr:hypothetical protein H0H87_007596 [Tephrocybe sp. NHM501043]